MLSQTRGSLAHLFALLFVQHEVKKPLRPHELTLLESWANQVLTLFKLLQVLSQRQTFLQSCEGLVNETVSFLSALQLSATLQKHAELTFKHTSLYFVFVVWLFLGNYEQKCLFASDRALKIDQRGKWEELRWVKRGKANQDVEYEKRIYF